MTIVDNVIAKNKMINYVGKAKNIDDLVIICQKFLEKYKPEVVSYCYMATMPAPVWQSKEVDVITASILIPAYIEKDMTDLKRHQLMSHFAEELLKSKMVEYTERHDSMSLSTILEARIGVCKP